MPGSIREKSQADDVAPLLPSSVQSLELPRYSTSSLTDNSMIIDEKSDLEGGGDYDGSTAGDDGLGVPPQQSGAWDDVQEVAEKDEEQDGLEGDDIEGWD